MIDLRLIQVTPLAGPMIASESTVSRFTSYYIYALLALAIVKFMEMRNRSPLFGGLNEKKRQFARVINKHSVATAISHPHRAYPMSCCDREKVMRAL